MPYIYEISFDIPRDKMTELEMGHSLQRVLGYLKITLPGEPGSVTSAAWYSLDDPQTARMVFFSEWASWDTLVDHRDSALLEDKVLSEFEPHVRRDTLTRRTYAEVGTEPY